MGILILGGFWLVLMVKFVRAFYVEAKRTSWTLLEALIAANILGHAVAIPIAFAYEDFFSHWMHRTTAVVMAAFAGITVAACMAGGAVWVFRRLKARNEQRFWIRIGYMVLGLLLFPSMVAFPWNLLVGWMIWVPLMNLGTTPVVTTRESVRERDE